MSIDIVKHNKLWLSITLAMVVAAVAAIFYFGLNFGIDFKGGTVLEYDFKKDVSQSELKAVFEEKGVKVHKVVPSGSLRTIYLDPVDEEKRRELEKSIQEKFSEAERKSTETIGPSVGEDLRNRALMSVGIVSLGIIIYLAYSFRKVPKPASSWEFGISAVIAMLHDVAVLFGIFAALGHFFGAEIDSLFVTAVLTVIGFSVHDTIVVFDRIRENLSQNPTEEFGKVVNVSLVETLARSVNLSVTVILTLTALFVLGGSSIRWFVVTLLIGIASGTYSSIFVASQCLVLWERVKGHGMRLKLNGIKLPPSLKLRRTGRRPRFGLGVREGKGKKLLRD